MGYFNFYIIKKIINSLFRYIRKNKRFIIIFIISACLLVFINEKCFAATYTTDFDIEEEIKQQQEQYITEFVSHSLYPYSGDTEYWQECILPVLDDINNNGKNFYISTVAKNSSRTLFRIYTFYTGVRTDNNFTNYKSNLNNETYSILQLKFSTSQYTCYEIRWFPDTNTGTLTIPTNTDYLYVPYILANYYSKTFTDFISLVRLGTTDYSIVLNDISDYLDSIDTVNTSILSTLNTITNSLTQITTNTSTNYSQELGQISSKISDILSDNDTIISQNSQMIQQQEEINDNLEDVNDSVQDLKDTITDDTVESTAQDLPSTDVTDPTQNGIDNIFQSIYNAFCVGQAQDIVFPIPFTDKNITLSPYYVSDMLNNNGAGWVYTLIQAFWGYLIGRFIISDISKKIDKIKSGNIENVENSNIKEEML